VHDFYTLRHFIYKSFAETGKAPLLSEFMNHFHLTRMDAEKLLERIDSEHLAVKLPFSKNSILLANPFSNIPTSHCAVVNGTNSPTYYRNCPWDLFGIHFALSKPITATTHCYQTGQHISMKFENYKLVGKVPDSILFLFTIPVSKWYQNLISTWHNTILIFSSEENLRNYLAEENITGETVTVQQLIAITKPFFLNRISADFTRPTTSEIQQVFQEAHLVGNFWKME